MKKNILAVIILAATIINLTLTAVMVFVFLPMVNKTNSLVTKVAQVIDLDLEEVAIKQDPLSVDDIMSYDVFSGKDMVVNLTRSKDGRDHLAKVKASLSVNKKSDDYSKVSKVLEQMDARVQEVINEEVSKLTFDDFLSKKDVVKEVILNRLQKEVFKSNCIIGITFSAWVTQ